MIFLLFSHLELASAEHFMLSKVLLDCRNLLWGFYEDVHMQVAGCGEKHCSGPQGGIPPEFCQHVHANGSDPKGPDPTARERTEPLDC